MKQIASPQRIVVVQTIGDSCFQIYRLTSHKDAGLSRIYRKTRESSQIKEQPLNEEEQELLESFERGKLKSVENLSEELSFAKEAAANYLRKDTCINFDYPVMI